METQRDYWLARALARSEAARDAQLAAGFTWAEDGRTYATDRDAQFLLVNLTQLAAAVTADGKTYQQTVVLRDLADVTLDQDQVTRLQAAMSEHCRKIYDTWIEEKNRLLTGTAGQLQRYAQEGVWIQDAIKEK